MNRPNHTETITHLLNSRRVYEPSPTFTSNPYKAVNLPFHRFQSSRHGEVPRSERDRQARRRKTTTENRAIKEPRPAQRDEDQVTESPGRTTESPYYPGRSERHHPSTQADP